MELCETCKNNNCNRRIVVKEENEIKTIKCLEYEKDREKIMGYKRPLDRTAKFQKAIMGFYNPSWN